MSFWDGKKPTIGGAPFTPGLYPPAVSHEATSTTGQANSGGGRDADTARIAAVLRQLRPAPSGGYGYRALSAQNLAAALYDAGLRPSVEPAGLREQAEALDQAYRRGWADREGRDRVFRVLDPDVPGPQETSYVLCQNCGGSGRNCPTCHGWGVEGPHRLCPECDAEGPA